MLPNGVLQKDEGADRRGRLSLLITIFFASINYTGFIENNRNFELKEVFTLFEISASK